MTEKDKNDKTTEQPDKPDATAAGEGLGQPPQVTFTQEQLDAIVRDRLERATKKTAADIMGELGIEDVETAKKTLADAQAAREAQMSELEKAQAQIADLEAKSEAARIEAEAIKARADEALLKSAIVAKATNFNDPMDAWSFVDRSKIETLDDGSYKGIDEALKALIEAKPYLIKADSSVTSPGTPPRKKSQSILEKMIENQQPERPKDADDIRPRITF